MKSKINPNAPQFLTWWKRKKAGGTHEDYASEINKRWDEFLKDERTDDEILDFARTTADDYIEHYWEQRHYLNLLELTIVSPSQIPN